MACVIVTTVVAGHFAIGRVHLDRHRSEIEAKLSAALGLAVTINGDLHGALLPRPRLTASGLSVANFPGRTEHPLLEIESVDLTLNLVQLLFGRIHIFRLSFEHVVIHAETDGDGRFRHEHQIAEVLDDDATDPIDLEIRALEIVDARVFYRNRQSDRVTTFHLERLLLSDDGWGKPVEFSAVGTADGADFDLHATGGPLSELIRGKTPYLIDLRGELFGAKIAITGKLADPGTFSDFDFGFEATLPNLGGLVHDTRAVMTRVGPVRVAGRIRDPKGVVGIYDFSGKIEPGGALNGTVTGSIDDLFDLAGVRLAATLAVDDSSALGSLVGRRLPQARLSAEVTLSDADGALGVMGVASASADDGRWSVRLEGDLSDLRSAEQLAATIRLEARDIAALGGALGIDTPLPAIGPLTATANLRDNEGAFSLEDIDVKLGAKGENWAEITGSVGNLDAFEVVSLKLTIEAPKAHELLAHYDRELAPGASLHATAHLTDGHGRLGLQDVRVRGAHPETIDVELSGSLDDLHAKDGIEFDARVFAKDLEVVGQVTGHELPAIGPVEFTGHIEGSNEGLRATGKLSIAQTTIRGDASGSWRKGQRPRITAQLRSKHLRLGDTGFFEITDQSGDAAARPKRSPQDPLPFGELRRLDLDLDLQADRITGRDDLDLQQTSAHLILKDGHLQVRDARTDYATGAVTWSFEADASTPLPRIDFRATVRSIDLTHLVSQFDADTKQAGRADLRVSLTSSGASMAALTRSLGGHFNGRVVDGNLATRYGQKFVREFSALSIPGFIPHPHSPVACILVDLAIEAGQVSIQQLEFDSEKVDVTGSGRIDLVAGSYHLRLSPVSHDPSLLSVSTAVDVTGPLAQPRFSAIPESIAISATRSLIMNATKPARRLLGAILPRSVQPQQRTCPSPFDSAR